MGLKDWRTRRRMADPVRGEFRVSGSYFPHPGSTPMRTMLTGVIVADGMPATPAEHMDRRAIGEFRTSLPVMVDRADPKRFLVRWDEIAPTDARAAARERAEADARAIRLGRGPTRTQQPVPDDVPTWGAEPS